MWCLRFIGSVYGAISIVIILEVLHCFEIINIPLRSHVELLNKYLIKNARFAERCSSFNGFPCCCDQMRNTFVSIR